MQQELPASDKTRLKEAFALIRSALSIELVLADLLAHDVYPEQFPEARIPEQFHARDQDELRRVLDDDVDKAWELILDVHARNPQSRAVVAVKDYFEPIYRMLHNYRAAG